jgi:hypothetical protein
VPTVDLIAQVLALVGSREELSKKLGVSLQQISRASLGESGLGPLPVVRMARLMARNIFDVLREAGHRELADELEPTAGRLVSPEQERVLDALNSLPGDVRSHYIALILERADHVPREHRKEKRSKQKRG